MVPVEPTPVLAEILPEKSIEVKGVYEEGSSVQGELQDFLKNDEWVKKTYPNLTDVERGKIAHLIQQAVAKDPEMMKGFNIRGGAWEKVGLGKTYDVNLDKDLLIKEIEKIHTPKGASAVVSPLQPEKAPLSIPNDPDTPKLEVNGAEESMTHEEKPLSTIPSEHDALGIKVTGAVESTTHESVLSIEKDVSVVTKDEVPPSIENDLEQAKSTLGPDYHGAATRPALEDLFKEGYFYNSSLRGQKNLILSYWGPMSHVDLKDIFDGNNKLTYTIGSNKSVTMGAGVEDLTRNVVTQLEKSLKPKIPNVSEIIEQSCKNNLTLGDLINELHLKLEAVEPFRPKVASPSILPKMPPLAPEAVPEIVPDTPAEVVPNITSTPEGGDSTPEAESTPKTILVDSHIEKIPLAEYKVPDVVTISDSVESPRATVTLVPIEVSKEIETIVNTKYPKLIGVSAQDPEFYKSPVYQEFKDMVTAQSVDIAEALKSAKNIHTVDLAKFSIDWSAYKDMKPAEVMMQLEQHEAMIRKLHPGVLQGKIIDVQQW